MKDLRICRQANGRVWARAVLALVLIGGAALGKVGTAHATPTISGSPASTVAAGSTYSFTPNAQDPNGHTLSFFVANRPSWLSLNSSTGTLSGTPTAAQVGRYPDLVMAVYAGGQSAILPAFSITVTSGSGGGSTPTVKISGSPASSVSAGSSYSFQPSATDSAGRTVSFSVQNKPSWSNFSISTGLLSGTPSSSQTGTYSNIVISASDGQASSALAPFSITVNGQSSGTGSATLSWVPPSTNTNGSTLTNFGGVRLYYGTSSSNLNHMVQIAGSGTTTYTISGLAAGTWYFGATAYNTAGIESAMSHVDNKAVL